MANTTFNVRIKNKYDSYENWAASGLVLEAGEIAVAYTTVNVEVGNGKIETHPELLMKVGNGEDTFANLPWLSAKAADVAAWAKAKDKPTYAATEITGIADYIAEYVEDTMGISVDTNDVFRILKVDDYNYKLQTKGKTDADTAWADVADSAIVIPNDTAAIEALQGLVGDEDVATQITNAIVDKADKATTLAGYGITDGMTKTEIEQAIEDAQYDDTALEGRVKANEDAIGVLNGNSSVEGSVDKKVADAINAFATAVSDDDTVNTYKELIDYAAEHGSEFTELVGEVTNNKNAIATLNGDASTVGSVDKKIADAIAAENLGQYATDDDLAGVAGRVTTAEGEIDQLQTDVDALEALVGDTDVATQISTAIDDLKLDETYDAKGAAATVQGALDEYIEANDAAVALKANDADLAAIAKTGNVNDLIQTEGDVIIFDCGTSAV